ncbi:hypothetical protein CEP68_03500 [Brevundimonas vesicularis]|uniref:Uncharacterized protein n=2 Tax=Brevundimonas vesicularis TaxID=41276 RepID=A0A1Z3U665_BREVE|nr:hypothetical protein CEP68_03500 [Brevundimonas vesicularis]
MLLKACRDAGKLGQGGGSVTEAAADTDADKLFETFKAAIAVMDSKDVDVETQEIYGVVTKTNWYALQGCEKLRNRDYNPAANVAATHDRDDHRDPLRHHQGDPDRRRDHRNLAGRELPQSGQQAKPA